MSTRSVRHPFNRPGMLDTSFRLDPHPDGEVRAVAVSNTQKVYIGGFFSHVGGLPRKNIACLNSNGSVDQNFEPDDTGYVNAVVVHQGEVLAGGGDLNIFSGSGSVNTGFAENVESIGVGNVNALLPTAGGILVGGTANVPGARARADYVVFRLTNSGRLDPGFEPAHTNGFVFSIALTPDGKVLVGGNFTTVNDLPYGSVVRLHGNGTIDTSFAEGSGFFGGQQFVRTVAPMLGGGTLVGGGLHANGVHQVVRLNYDGSPDPTFNQGENGASQILRASAVQPEHRFLIAGDLAYYNQIERRKIARINQDGSLDPTFIPDRIQGAQINDIALYPKDKVVIVGSFSEIGGTPIRSVARLHTGKPLVIPDEDEIGEEEPPESGEEPRKVKKRVEPPPSSKK